MQENNEKVVAIGCDHGGLCLREAVLKAVKESGFSPLDFGTFTDASVDYPDYAEKVCKAVVDGKAKLGILMCGTGIGMSIYANKVRGIRCAHVTDEFSGKMCRNHNDANVMAVGGRISTPDEVYTFVKAFLTEKFEGGRHKLRLDKLNKLDYN